MKLRAIFCVPASNFQGKSFQVEAFGDTSLSYDHLLKDKLFAILFNI